ncbi:membrane protein [Staphylococcus phage CF9]|uniref:Membrane protein n=1 Tax=Staphylococcus phage CF9 TaxID=3113741 RepID=A0AAX4J7A5_9CAUD|nr:membrane protein [Staphylococcus phage CF9]
MIVYSKQTNLTKTRTFVHSEWTIFAFLWGFYILLKKNQIFT